MEWPPGYPSKDKGKIVKLLKGLYGLKQASRLWQQTLYECLLDTSVGLKVCKTESGTMYLKDSKGNCICIVLVYVDDLIICCHDKTLREKIVKLLASNFILKCMGDLELYVGIVVTKDKDNIKGLETMDLDQEPYNNRYVGKYLPDDDNRTSKIPACPERLSATDCPTNQEDKPDYPYINVTGSLLYAAICTRPDIFYATMQLARFNSNPGFKHVEGSKRLLRYVNNTANLGIRYTKSKDFKGKMKITAFVDSDWGGCIDTRRSTMGYIIHMANGPVSWKSKLMKTLALSSCEGEFMALTEVCRELMWLCRFLDEIGIPYEIPEVYCDSASAINWSLDPIQAQRNKHVEMRYYYCRDICANNCVRLFKIHTTFNCADIMTKPVGYQILSKLAPPAMGHCEPTLKA